MSTRARVVSVLISGFFLFISGLAVAAAASTSHSAAPTPAPMPGKSPSREHAPSRTSAAPVNDNCSGAIAITSVPFTDSQNTAAATNEPGEPPSSCTGSGKSVWYTYVDPLTNTVLVTVDTIGSDFNTTLQILTGTCPPGAMTVIMCGDDANVPGNGLQSRVTFAADPGVPYYIQVGGYGSDSGNLILNVNANGGLCPATTIQGAFDGTQSSQTGRMNLNGVVSSCSTPKACAVNPATGSFTFAQYTIPNNSGVDECLTVNLQNDPALLCSLESVAYLDSFDPANICTNFLADPGESTNALTRSTTMSFVLPAGHNAVLVVHDINAGASLTCGYTLTVVGDTCAEPLMTPESETPDAHAIGGDNSNHNGVFEPGETAQIDLGWANNGTAPRLWKGVATSLSGPFGPTYTINDSTADYGSVAPGATNDCFTATGNCYQMTISGARPAQHWDAMFTETLNGGVATKIWTLHLGNSFADVPPSFPFYRFVENLFHNGVTAGCDPGDFCPGSPVTRAQMAVFVLRSEHGDSYTPPACSSTLFADEPCPGGAFVNWVNQLVAENVTSGCGGGNYCPTTAVTRAQMAVFLLKAKHGPAYTPPACSSMIFADVPCPGPVISDYINELSAEGITAGCGGGNYCPSDPNTRGQMAVFLVTTFQLKLYGP